jgi:hypothetical protein
MTAGTPGQADLGPVEVPETGALAVHVKSGGTIIIAPSAGLPPERAAELREALAASAPDATVIVVKDAAAVRSWHPGDGDIPRERLPS